ncbi:uncharacterized protein LOC126893282 [Diabrotica virgifera virgifera]|uniref:MULE transposase domain-containing protein n=1 Tax=Diabrotica virgifera virgifera TaxID=50390 RepID=A0ABM5L9Z2_DIAVI|nr:uncharacterized protein LOC126893282 [Diabrotica virgifera virgifera]
MATYISTKRGQKKLIFQEYFYHRVRSTPNGRTYWTCGESCGGSAITIGDGNDGENVIIRRVHNHGPSHKIGPMTVQHKIREAASSSHYTPRDVVNTALEGISDDTKVHLPQLTSMQKMVRKVRRRNQVIPRVPHSFRELIIPNELRRTKTSIPQDFILSDTGIDDQNRIIIFGCTLDLTRLIQCDTWVVDGTFKSAPNLWYQLWIIHGVFHNKTLPFIYAFLPNKNERSYERSLIKIFEKIDIIRPGARPNTIVIDFEMAVVNTFRRLVPNIRVHGCFFHFCQAIWRKVQQLGLAQLYRDEQFFKTLIKSFCALSFVPPAEVSQVFELLETELIDSFGEDERCHSFIDYFITTWVGRTLPPRNPYYAIGMWNCNNITLEGLPRTTNSAESFHHAFNSMFSCRHPNPYILIEKLIKEQLRQDLISSRLEAGLEEVQDNRYQRANGRLANLLRNYNNMNVGQFLEECGQHITYNV